MSFRLAERQALKSTFKQHRLGAVIVKGGRVLSTGFNKYGYTKELKFSTIHAEEMAIVKCLKKGWQHHLVGSSLFVTRFTHGGAVGISKPCLRCASLLTAVGIRNVHYNDVTGHVKTMKIH